jgi:hypothetical protein
MNCHRTLLAACAAALVLGGSVAAVAAAAPRSGPRQTPTCTTGRDKTAAPATIRLGETVTVTLEITGTCPVQLVPADVILALDHSGSMGRDGKIEAAKAAAITFVQRTDPAQTHVGLVAIAGTAERVIDLTDDRSALAAAIQGLYVDAGTNLVDGLAESRRALSGGAVRPGANRFIVYLTDGRHTVLQPPASDLDRVIAQVRADGIIVYSIGLGNDLDARTLRRMATSPTHYYFAPSGADLERIYREIAQRIEAPTVFQNLRVSDVVPGNMDFVAGTGQPFEPDLSADGKTLTWAVNDVVAPGITFTYQLRPRQVGTWPTNVAARVDYHDGFGNAGSQVFPVPAVRVLPLNPTPTPPPTATPPPNGAACVCDIVQRRVPPAVVADALAHPDRYYGWQYELDGGKPGSRANPPRLCLTLWNVNLDYQPLWNAPRWRVGCP